MGFRTERWSIKPLSCPRPVRYCPDCGVAREFVCSERFRINAQKKIIDVWLKYRCAECDNVWKFPVIERRPVAALDVELQDAFLRHDPATVWKYAFDVGRLRSNVIRVTTDVAIVVERMMVENDASEPAASNRNLSGLVIRFDVPFACGIRLDRLLASELCVSRATIARWFETGILQVQSDSKALGKPVYTGLRVVIRDDVQQQLESKR